MAVQEYWVGSFGPFLYDDTKQYSDGVYMTAFRGLGVSTGGAAYTTMTTVEALQAVYPITSVYFSTDSTPPATALGFGTWTALSGRTYGTTYVNAWLRTA